MKPASRSAASRRICNGRWRSSGIRLISASHRTRHQGSEANLRHAPGGMKDRELPEALNTDETPACARFQDAEDGVRRDHGPSRGFALQGWCRRRGQARRARLRPRTVRSDRCHGAVAGQPGQCTSTRRLRFLPDHITLASGLQQSHFPGGLAGRSAAWLAVTSLGGVRMTRRLVCGSRAASIEARHP